MWCPSRRGASAGSPPRPGAYLSPVTQSWLATCSDVATFVDLPASRGGRVVTSVERALGPHVRTPVRGRPERRRFAGITRSPREAGWHSGEIHGRQLGFAPGADVSRRREITHSGPLRLLTRPETVLC